MQTTETVWIKKKKAQAILDHLFETGSQKFILALTSHICLRSLDLLEIRSSSPREKDPFAVERGVSQEGKRWRAGSPCSLLQGRTSQGGAGELTMMVKTWWRQKRAGGSTNPATPQGWPSPVVNQGYELAHHNVHPNHDLQEQVKITWRLVLQNQSYRSSPTHGNTG